jgi:hypothetical protein
MPDHQTIIVTQDSSNDGGGCLGGCGTLLGVMLVVGLLVKCWYVAVPVAVLAVGVAIWLSSRFSADGRFAYTAALGELFSYRRRSDGALRRLAAPTAVSAERSGIARPAAG